MSFKIKDGITWVGKIDWELRTFHGEELSTHRGTSYNAYLVEDEKTVLIDTVWAPFSKEFVNDLKKVIDLNKIDYIVMNHGEKDHSGALPELMREIPDTPIYCTENAVKSLKGQYHQDWNFEVVKTGDTLNLGSKDLVFVEMSMLHWPDSMLCYLTEDNIVFSSDAFGQHYATELMYNDLASSDEIYQEAIKYYANILNPFSALVKQKINEILKMKLPIDMICPSHGLIWRDNPTQIINTYMEWAEDYKENQITIIYDTMWNGTRRMAESIAEGIKTANPNTDVKLFNCARSDKNDIATEVFKSKGVVVGSSTINGGILSSVAAILEQMEGLKLGKGKKAASFGAYGWSGESAGIISKRLKECGFEVLEDSMMEMWYPDNDAIENCINFGKSLSKSFKI